MAELQGRGGSPGSTLRARLKDLVNADVVVVRRNRDLPGGSAEYELTVAGEELLFVAEVLESWLADSPNASHALGEEGARAAIKALVEGWSATLLRALAAKPLSIADLDSLIGGFNYPSLERRIAAMRLTGQVRARPASGREVPYAVTSWLRRGVAPLAAAIRWEHRYLEGAAPISAIDVEAIFLLAMPLLSLEADLSGRCRMAVELPQSRKERLNRDLAGVLAAVQGGALASCTSRLDGEVDGWASGPFAAWLPALIDDDTSSLELGGDGRLVRGLTGAIQRALFGGAPQRRGSVPPLEDLAEPAL